MLTSRALLASWPNMRVTSPGTRIEWLQVPEFRALGFRVVAGTYFHPVRQGFEDEPACWAEISFPPACVPFGGVALGGLRFLTVGKIGMKKEIRIVVPI